MPKRRTTSKSGTGGTPPQPPAPPLPHFPLVRAGIALTAILIALAAFAPNQRLWGLNHLAYYSLPLRLAAIALIALAFVPAVARAVYRFATSIPAALARAPRPASMTVLVVVALLATAALVQFRVATNLLGDGQLIEQSFEAGFKGNAKVIMRSPSAIIHEEKIARGSLLVSWYAAALSVNQFGKTPGLGIRILNCLIGGAFVFLLLKLIRDAPYAPAIRAWLLILGLFSCAVQLYFGYMENYTILFFFLFLYVTTAFRAFHRGATVWFPAVIGLIACYVHVQGILFLPSLLYLISWRRLSGRQPRLLDPILTALVSATVVAAVVARFFPKLSDFFMPLVGSDEGDGVISPGHLIDIANELFLLLPILPAVVLMAWADRRPGPGKQKDPGAAPFETPVERRFAALMLLPCLLYILLFNVEIGMARDWDLFAMTVVALIPLTLMVITRYTRDADPSRFALVAAPALVTTIVFGLSWFGVNASSARSTDRFEHILAYDQTHASYAYENLSIFYYDSGDMERAIEIMRTATEISRNPRQYVRLSMYLYEDDQKEEAVQILRDVLARRPNYVKARYKLIEYMQKGGNWAAVVETARGGIQVTPRDAILHFYMGQGLIATGNVDAGLRAFATSKQLGPPEKALEVIEAAFRTYGTPEQ